MVEESGGLQTGLKRRHVTMIALGGVIGAGLFVGSGAVVNQTGPAAGLSPLVPGGRLWGVSTWRPARALRCAVTGAVLAVGFVGIPGERAAAPRPTPPMR